jgi:hypothetical protein
MLGKYASGAELVTHMNGMRHVDREDDGGPAIGQFEPLLDDVTD